MVKFSKLGAAALALALTVTFVAPTPVNAYTVEVDSANVDYSKSGDVTTYKNKANGKTWTSNSKQSEIDDALNVAYQPKNIEVEVNSSSTYTISSGYGGYKITDVKIKKGKNVITAKVQGTSSSKDIPYYFCETDEQGKHYYYDQYGKKVEVSDEEYAKTTTIGTATVRIFAKKAGTAVIQYKVEDVDGKVIATKSLKVVVKDEILTFKSVSFAGDKISYDPSATQNQKKKLSIGYATDMGYSSAGYDFVTTKKGGKFKVTPAANYKVTAVWVGTENEWIPDPDSKYGSYMQKKSNNGIAKDSQVDGIEGNDEATTVWTKKRNGAKITLSKNLQKSNYKSDYSVSSSERGYTVTEVRVIVQHKKTKQYFTIPFDIARIVKK